MSFHRDPSAVKFYEAPFARIQSVAVAQRSEFYLIELSNKARMSLKIEAKYNYYNNLRK